MKRRRQSRSPMPPIPLELAYPLEVPGPEVAGARLLRELPGDAALRVVEALRMVHAIRDVERTGPLFTRDAVWAWEARRMRDLARTAMEAPDAELALEDGLAEIARLIADPDGLDRRKLSWACLMVLECALAEGWRETAAAFAEAAAIACPYAPYPAYIIGKLHRRYGNYREAEAWLKRGARVARWAEDWENYALILNSLGVLHYQKGSYPLATQHLLRARKVARRFRFKTLEGEILHDLFVATWVQGESSVAEEYARTALFRYLPDHPRMPALAYDIAYYWVNRGYFAFALTVIVQLLAVFRTPDERFMVCVCAARAAAGTGDTALFRRMWMDAWTLKDSLAGQAQVGTALVDLGLGASSVGDWEGALKALNCAVEYATAHGEGDVLLRAEAALEAVSNYKPADREPRPARSVAKGRSHPLATVIVSALSRYGVTEDEE